MPGPEFWLLICDGCAHEQYIPRNRWNYERDLIEAEVRTHYATCLLCHSHVGLV